MVGKKTKASETHALQERPGYHDSSKVTTAQGEQCEGFVHRILGPDGKEWRWLARSIHGFSAHGRTPEDAVESLRAGLQAMAAASGLSYAEWFRLQKPDGSRFVGASELVPD